MNYSEKLEQVKKYAQSQGVSIDSPRVKKYAKAMGVDPDELNVELTDEINSSDEAAQKYADRMGLPVTHPVVRKYIESGTEEEPEIIDIEGSDDVRFKEAVLHYAQSQNLSLDDRRVQKYARGLLIPQGDFNEERRTEVVDPETAERRFNEAIQRYAERCGVPVDSEQVQKYARGLRKTKLIPVVQDGDSHASH
jgi:ribosomal protein L12E/L44/L45/RPP1/RPP2